MCRNLEEENGSLSQVTPSLPLYLSYNAPKTVESLQRQLQEVTREASVQQLLPHYRLAIVRARSFSANLQEQLRREQVASAALRDQLQETYLELKRAVADKRRMMLRTPSAILQRDYHDHNQLQHQVEKDLAHISEPLPPPPVAAEEEKEKEEVQESLQRELQQLDGEIGSNYI